MKVAWTHRARADLLQIGRYIARNDPSAARRWLARIKWRIAQASEFPLSGRLVPELRSQDVREVIDRKYRIVYLVSNDTIVVLTVLEGHRLLPLSRNDIEEKS